jgi:hypothetical protein
MKTKKHLLNIFLITLVYYLFFSLLNWSFCTSDWSKEVKIGFGTITMFSWALYILTIND